MPAGKRGTKPTPPGGPTGTYAPAAAKQSHGTTATLQRPQEGHVAFALAVVCDTREALLAATWGGTPRPMRWMRAPYRGRFGLASS